MKPHPRPKLEARSGSVDGAPVRQKFVREVDLTPYPCFSRTCGNLVTPTKDSRPWHCPECTQLIKDAIRQEVVAKLTGKPHPRKRFQPKRRF